MKNLFDTQAVDKTTERINALTSDTQGQWGKKSVDQMLAHCNVTYEMVYDNIHPKPTGLKKFFIKLFAKKAVVGPDPYPKNGRTAPQFIVTDKRDFAKEKGRIIDYLRKTQELSADHFEGKESNSFAPLTSQEWNVMFSKHLDHHLTQFGV